MSEDWRRYRRDVHRCRPRDWRTPPFHQAADQGTPRGEGRNGPGRVRAPRLSP